MTVEPPISSENDRNCPARKRASSPPSFARRTKLFAPASRSMDLGHRELLTRRVQGPGREVRGVVQLRRDRRALGDVRHAPGHDGAHLPDVHSGRVTHQILTHAGAPPLISPAMRIAVVKPDMYEGEKPESRAPWPPAKYRPGTVFSACSPMFRLIMPSQSSGE